MAIVVPNDDESLEACTLTSSCLFLHWHDLHYLILQRGQKKVDDLILLDGHGEVVDVVNVANLPILDETAELGARDPLLLIATALALAFALATLTLATSTFAAKTLATTKAT